MKKPKQSPQTKTPNPASAVLREPLSAADRLSHLHRQHFVIREMPPSAQTMKPEQPPDSQKPVTDDEAGRSVSPWEDSSGEGAASALESLRKLEQSRNPGQRPEEKPAAE
jgi:hypothetical protein